MPARRAHALNLARVVAGGLTVAQEGPAVVKVAVAVDVGCTAVRMVTVGSFRGSAAAKVDDRIVGIFRGAEVLTHPALLTQLNGFVCVAVGIGYGAAAAGGSGGEGGIFAIDSANRAYRETKAQQTAKDEGDTVKRAVNGAMAQMENN